MLLRQALLAAVLVAGSAASVAAQSEEFPFRRFAPRHRITVRPDVHSFRFSLRDQHRFQQMSDRLRLRLQSRSWATADRIRLKEFSSRDMAERFKSRAFTMRDKAGRRQMELHFRNMDKVQDRIRARMDKFRFEPRLKFHRHSRVI
jgi:hypothetical protein